MRRLPIAIATVIIVLCVNAWAQSPGGFLGLIVKPVPREVARVAGIEPFEGAMVVQIVEGGPAAHAGIRAGDIIINLDGRKVTGPEQLASRISSRAPGSILSVEVARQRQRLVLPLALGSAQQGLAQADLPKSIR